MSPSCSLRPPCAPLSSLDDWPAPRSLPAPSPLRPPRRTLPSLFFTMRLPSNFLRPSLPSFKTPRLTSHQLAADIFQRIPPASQLVVLVIAIWGPRHAPLLFSLMIILVHATFVASNARTAYGMRCALPLPFFRVLALTLFPCVFFFLRLPRIIQIRVQGDARMREQGLEGRSELAGGVRSRQAPYYSPALQGNARHAAGNALRPRVASQRAQGVPDLSRVRRGGGGRGGEGEGVD